MKKSLLFFFVLSFFIVFVQAEELDKNAVLGSLGQFLEKFDTLFTKIKAINAELAKEERETNWESEAPPLALKIVDELGQLEKTMAHNRELLEHLLLSMKNNDLTEGQLEYIEQILKTEEENLFSDNNKVTSFVDQLERVIGRSLEPVSS